MRKKMTFEEGALFLARCMRYATNQKITYGSAVVQMLEVSNDAIAESDEVSEVSAWFYRTQVESFNPVSHNPRRRHET